MLMANTLRLLAGRDDKPKYIVLWNGGVNLALGGSESIEYLKALQADGVRIILCRTCVDYFDIESKIAVGTIQSMVRIHDILAGHEVLTI